MTLHRIAATALLALTALAGHGHAGSERTAAAPECSLHGLKQPGYTMDADWTQHPSREADIAFALVAGGRHEQASWKRMLPEFLH